MRIRLLDEIKQTCWYLRHFVLNKINVQTHLDLDQKIKWSIHSFILRVKNMGAVNTPEKFFLYFFRVKNRGAVNTQSQFIHRKYGIIIPSSQKVKGYVITPVCLSACLSICYLWKSNIFQILWLVLCVTWQFFLFFFDKYVDRFRLFVSPLTFNRLQVRILNRSSQNFTKWWHQ